MDKTKLQTKTVPRDKEGHYTLIEGIIQQKDITTVNTYAPNIGVPKYIKQTLTNIKGETNRKTILVGDFNTPLTPIYKSSRQKINKETLALNDTLDQTDLLYNSGRIHILFKCTLKFSRVDDRLGHKTSLNKFKKIEIISSIFSDHSGMRLEITTRKRLQKTQTCGGQAAWYWTTNGSLETLKKKLKIPENGRTHFQNQWDSGKAILRGELIVKETYTRKQEKSQISHFTLHLKELEKEEQANSK